jgi:hypothetical protein
LTRNQLRQVTGFFKPLETPQAVRNLVHFELWNADDTPEVGAVIGKFGKRFKLPKDFKIEAETFSKPVGELKNEMYRKYSVQDESITIRAQLVASINTPLSEDPEIYDKFKVCKITCGV